MADAISVYDLIPAQPAAKPKSGGIKVADLAKPVDPTPTAQPSGPLARFASQAADVAKTAAKSWMDDPEATMLASGRAVFEGGVQMINTAASGVAALAKSMWTPVKVDPRLTPQQQAAQNLDQSINGFVGNQKKIQSALDGVNKAPVLKQEEAMTNLLGLIPEGINAIGDDVYERTGSALAATGALSLATLLSLSPDVASRTLKRVREAATPKTETDLAKPPSKVSSAFDEMAAKHPEAAGGLADHVEQVDPMLAKYLKRRIQKFTDASDRELSIIGKNAADAAIEELSGDYEKIRAQANLPGYLGSGAERGMGSGESGTSKRSRVRSGPSGLLDADGDAGLSVGEGKGGRTRPARTQGSSIEDDRTLSTGESKGGPSKSSRVKGTSVEDDTSLRVGQDKGPKTRAMAALDPKAPTFGHFDNIDEGMFDRYAELDSKGGTIKATNLLYEMDKHATGATETGSLQRQLISRLQRLVPNIQIHFTDDLVGSSGERFDEARGIYDGATNKIKISIGRGGDTHAILHELTHAATTRFIHYNPDHPLVVELEKLRQAAESVLKKSGEKYSVRSHYGLEDVHEFVAEAMTNRDFQAFLGHIKTLKKETLMSRFVDTVKNILGYKPGDNVRFLERVIRTSEDLMETAGKARREGKTIPGKSQTTHAAPKLTAEQVASTIRTAAKEITEAVTKGEDKKPDGGQPLYLSGGIPITRQMVESAFTFGGSLFEKLPGVKIAEAKMASLYETFIETFNPEAVGKAAKTAGAAIARNFFQQAMKEHQVWTQGIKRREYWLKMGPKASMDFIDGMEKGTRFDNPIREKARQAYRNWNMEMVRQDIQTYAGSGKDLPYEPREHYLAHLFEDNEGVIRWAQKKYGNKWADPRFTKDRSFNLYREAIDAGFTPKFTNPEEIMQARQHASDIAALRTDLLAELERQGVAVKATKGAERPPEGFSPNSRRSPTGVRYWVKEDADPLMRNVFDSESLWNLQGSKLKEFVSNRFKNWMGVKNALIPIKLGLSLFHPMHVLHIDASATLARETKNLLGNPSLQSVRSFMLNAATAYLQPLWSSPRMGSPLLRVFQGKMDFEKLSDADKAAFRDLAEGGMVPTRPREETSGQIQKLKDAIAKQSATALWHAPWAALAAISHPLFSVWIPDLKIASYLKDVKVARELNPNWTDMERQEAFRQIARKVEARYGEMNYNSLFMNKILKDIGVASSLSLGWNLGLLDQYVGGAIDLGKAGKRIALDTIDPESKGSEVKRQLAAGGLDRPIFMTYYIASAMMIGGAMQYFFTGKPPQQFIDYTHPQSGDKDQYGKPVRLNTMFYTREFEGLYKHIEQEGFRSGMTDFVKNKGSGLMEMAEAAYTGINSLGDNIRNPEDPAYKQFEQTLANTLTGLNPIALEAIEKSTGSPVKSTTLSVLGFTPAGKYISESVIEGQIASDFNKFVRPKEKSYTAVQMAKDVKDLRGMFAKDDPKYDDKMEEAAKKYDWTDKDVHRLEKMFNSPKEQEFDPSIYMFQKLQWPEQKALLNKMTEGEKETYLPHISKAKRQKYERELEEATP